MLIEPQAIILAQTPGHAWEERALCSRAREPTRESPAKLVGDTNGMEGGRDLMKRQEEEDDADPWRGVPPGWRMLCRAVHSYSQLSEDGWITLHPEHPTTPFVYARA